MLDQISFFEAIERARSDYEEQSGIGTLGEKMLHRTLKFYFEPDESKHEINYLGSVADIRNDEGITEIQTRAFGKLIPKLEWFLNEECVTVVYPIIESRMICRIDTETGESLPPRKSSKKGRGTDALAELSLIRRFIPHKNLRILVLFVDVVETRLLNGKIRVGRKRTDKINCIPTSLNSIIQLKEPSDYFSLLPENLPDSFTATEFEKLLGLHGIHAHGALMLLLQLGILRRERQGKEAYVYTLNKTN